MRSFCQAAGVLPPGLRRAALALPEEVQERGEELRLRLGRGMTVSLAGVEREVPGAGIVRGDDLGAVLEIATQASAHTALEQVRRGFVTVRGGHRIGLCGTAAAEGGAVKTLRFLSSVNIRVAREVKGAAGDALPLLRRGTGVASTLILAPPGAGKTTLLRDLIRALSDGEGGPPLRVGVADERGELASLWEGRPCLDVGAHTDVMDGCPKAVGLELLLRGMSPQVLAMDEITAPADAAAAEQAAGCGVALLATAHAGTAEDLVRRPLYRGLLERGVFQKLLTIDLAPTGERTVKVIDLSELTDGERGVRG